MPPYSIHTVNTRAELDAITTIIWAAMPGKDRSHEVFYPILDDPQDGGTGSVAARQRAIEQTQARLWQEHKSDPASHWIYVTADNEDLRAEGKRIVGGCQWRCYQANPFPNGMPEIEAVWWPPGLGRRFATEVVKQCYRPRTVVMDRPHVGLSLMAVQPEHQRAGIGSLLMKWGIERADSLGLEMFIEATPQGRHLYLKSGFRDVARVNVDMSHVEDTPRQSADWQRLEDSLLPIGYVAVWRPVRGEWDEGEPSREFAGRLEGLKPLTSVTTLV